jgi:hypothetical protein
LVSSVQQLLSAAHAFGHEAQLPAFVAQHFPPAQQAGQSLDPHCPSQQQQGALVGLLCSAFFSAAQAVLTARAIRKA